jgi:hypothetical protein
MMHTLNKSWYLVAAGVAALLVATGPLGAQVTFDLTGVGSGTVLDGIYTSPYTATINGVPQINAICDDFSDESYNPEDWTADVTSVSSLGSTVDSTLMWGGASGNVTIGSNHDSWTLTQVQAYDVAAVLANEIVSAPAGSQYQQDLSYALWGLFDPDGTATNPWGAFNYLTGTGFSTDAGNALTYLENAITYTFLPANSVQVQADINGATIYSYAGGATCPDSPGGVCANIPPQEFITVPEASTPVLLAVDLLGFMALVGFLRKRMARSIRPA